MEKNSVRTSSEMATIASHALAGRFDQAALAMCINNLLLKIEAEEIAEEIMKSLAGSTLSNRRD